MSTKVLQQAASAHAGKIFYCVSDAGNAVDRVRLLDWVKGEHPDCNALVNNAGKSGFRIPQCTSVFHPVCYTLVKYTQGFNAASHRLMTKEPGKSARQSPNREFIRDKRNNK